MKRLVFCFDGTWNRLSAEDATNVVLTAASIERQAPDATQIIHYDEGVGTRPWERLRGGVVGWGLVQNVRAAYRFLIFNYDPGDQIFVFGFSRGAFSARSFIGFLRHVGVLRRLYAARIDEALDLYKRRLADADGSGDRIRRFRAKYSSTVCIGPDDEAWRCEHDKEYVPGSGHLLTIRYLGVWDTVGALGVPAFVPFSARLNRRNQFHDVALTPFVESARHAVAVDERRVLFPCTLWGDLTEINRAKGFEPGESDAPYQEKWFQGTHGSVGGGGDIRGLSDRALAWVTKGAKIAGLVLDREKGSRIHGFEPQPLAPLENTRKPARFDLTHMMLADRAGPEYECQVSLPIIRRWHSPKEKLPEGQPYRPVTLVKVKNWLDAYPVRNLLPSDLPRLCEHTVQSGDTLSALAKHYYGDSKLWKAIFDANRGFLDEPDDVYKDQTLRIPDLGITPQSPTETA